MPCYRCGVRQTDPGRGQSPWKRGVRQYSQILICPGCQDGADWTADLDRCSQCSSVHLVKRLGEVECRDCGTIVPPEASGESGSAEAQGGPALADPGLEGQGSGGPGEAGLAGSGPGAAARSADLSEEVARALDRVLSRSLVSQSLQRAPDPEGKAGSAAGRHRPARAAAGHARRLIRGRNASARPGRAGPERARRWPARPAWMRSGRVRSRGERAGGRGRPAVAHGEGASRAVSDAAVVGRVLREYHARGIDPAALRRAGGSVHAASVSYLVRQDGARAWMVRACRADAPGRRTSAAPR